MPTFSIQDIVNRAADIADIHDNFVEPETWVRWFNFEIRALALRMARAGGALSDFQTISINPPANTADQYLLVGDYTAIVGVWEVRPDFSLRQVRIVPFVDNNFITGGGFGTSGPAQVVSIERSSLNSNIDQLLFRFFPRDPSGIYFICALTAPQSFTDILETANFPVGCEEAVALRLAKRALIREESDVSEIKEMIKEVDAHVEDFCWGQTFAQANSVRNVDSVQRGWGTAGSLILPPSDQWMWL